MAEFKKNMQLFKLGKIIVLIVALSAISITLWFFASNQAKTLQRDTSVLMDRYYLLKQSNPEGAKKALMVILRQNNNDVPALKELSQIYLRKKNTQEALPLIKHLHQLLPDNPDYTLQLGRLYYEDGNWQNAYLLFKMIKKNEAPALKIDAQIMLNKMATYLPNYKIDAFMQLKKVKQEDEQSIVAQILLNYFYKIKVEDLNEAKKLLSFLDLMIKNPMISEEMGYFALQEGHQIKAIAYFLSAYSEKPSAQLALQLAYLYMNQKNDSEAAQFFLVASLSNDLKIKTAALRGYELANQTKDIAAGNKPINSKSIAIPSSIKSITASREKVLLDQFYTLKRKNKHAAWLLIKQIIASYPNNILALKEGGFLAIEEGYRIDSISYFTKAYDLTYQADLAMQLGYLYDSIP